LLQVVVDLAEAEAKKVLEMKSTVALLPNVSIIYLFSVSHVNVKIVYDLKGVHFVYNIFTNYCYSYQRQKTKG